MTHQPFERAVLACVPRLLRLTGFETLHGSTDNQAPGGGKRYFVRRFGRRIRLRAEYGTPEFAIEYAP